jgi:hypothetical protein
LSESHDPHDLGSPPPAPEVPRRVHLYRSQWIGLPLLVLLPLLALANVFGEARQTRTIGDDRIRVEVEHPTRLRVRQHSTVHVRIDRLAGTAADSIRVVFDPAWIGHFTKVSVVPDPEHAWTVLLSDLAAGIRADVRVELEGTRLWRSRGWLRVEHVGGPAHDIELATFILP